VEIRGILFDWGGTLAHVHGQAEALMRGAAEALAILVGRSDPDLVRSMMMAAVQAEKDASAHPEHREVDLTVLLKHWAADHGIAAGNDSIEKALDAIGRQWIGSALTPVHGARETLQTLRAMGLHIALVSNCFIPPKYCWDELREQRIDDLLDCAVFSSSVGYRKPSRHIYGEAMRQLAAAGGPQVWSQLMFVGDSPAYDVITPAALGMRTALVSSSAGLWLADDYERARPDFRIDSVTELPVLLADLS
jgi:FMN phosphatase YigB (HAD superfamily)